jgi:hypothetical protein
MLNDVCLTGELSKMMLVVDSALREAVVDRPRRASFWLRFRYRNANRRASQSINDQGQPYHLACDKYLNSICLFARRMLIVRHQIIPMCLLRRHTSLFF